ncbi:PepSY domain-containing protein [Jiulongibacter sediminis]|uniref:Membrane protein n=1 Tax=Jiulongibacter sediminis TaxID=1605367 RepID=A0A0P7C476_9BACT|nr:PepSY domain-containing protein [Jiulongibacter sediminis]KPM47998.1 membrane protein [Jiulongibacter sediminis]TBX24180.1 membrane protein [Jiulongibacter sediminis]
MTSKWMRVIHRYLGFFLAGIMAMYALSGMVMIYRTTDFLKEEKHMQKTLEPGLNAEGLGPALRMRLQVQKEEGDIIYFNDGTYNKVTGEADYTVKELPTLLHKMETIHKATVNSPLYFLNIFFGLSLLFFVISTFWMFAPQTKIFKKGLWFTAGGIMLTIILLYV